MQNIVLIMLAAIGIILLIRQGAIPALQKVIAS